MKKAFILIVLIATLSCNSDSKKDSSPEAGNSPGIQNANGNIPDTTNSINLTTSSSEKKDTTEKSADSLRK